MFWPFGVLLLYVGSFFLPCARHSADACVSPPTLSSLLRSTNAFPVVLLNQALGVYFFSLCFCAALVISSSVLRQIVSVVGFFFSIVCVVFDIEDELLYNILHIVPFVVCASALIFLFFERFRLLSLIGLLLQLVFLCVAFFQVPFVGVLCENLNGILLATVISLTLKGCPR